MYGQQKLVYTTPGKERKGMRKESQRDLPLNEVYIKQRAKCILVNMSVRRGNELSDARVAVEIDILHKSRAHERHEEASSEYTADRSSHGCCKNLLIWQGCTNGKRMTFTVQESQDDKWDVQRLRYSEDRQPVCYKCHRPGHIRRDCYNTENQSQRYYKSLEKPTVGQLCHMVDDELDPK
ncbi:hypothetical protein PR048_018775 [Dryococelus australis]|uniref:CCHC-type domain-containing protein n=1 Tax=Dryococelus australis TaxID=614101 RepID=A0ABQ9HD71_9NEOP|nr:hypothetical protein PR048_018775 [Dryococelus australis]